MTTGRVKEFDVQRGDGVIRSLQGEELYFHCVVIEDGSRTVDIDQTVTFKRSVGHLGRDEAAQVVKVAAAN